MKNYSLADRAHDLIMSLSDDECRLLLRAWELHEENPELTAEECVERATMEVTV